MKQKKYLIYILVCFCMFFCTNTLYASSKKQKVYVIPVFGTVEPGMAAYVKRALEEIKDETDAVFVFKLDTFGGRVDAALEIVDTISNVPKGKTIAFVEKRAISAGALIALSSNLLFMKNHTIIGDCAPIIQTQEGQKMAGEKIQTVLRARFRALAKKNNYPVVLAESMVTIDMEVYQVEIDGQKKFMDKKAYDDLTEKQKKKITSKKTIVAKGELLTMDDVEALDLGFSQKSVKSIEQALSFAGYDSIDVITIEESWSESLVRFLQPFLPVLMLIGIGAIYTEIKAPGFGIPGFIGITCLGLVFFNQYLVGLADYTELLLLLIGVLLLGVEVFVLPGFGIAGISGLAVIAVGLVLSFQQFVVPDPSFPWEGRLLMKNLALVLGSFMFAFFISLFMIRFVLPLFSKLVKGPYLEETLSHSHVDATTDLNIKPGDTGTAHSFLRPSGKVLIHNKKIDAITRGEFIDQGTPVIIDKIDQNRVIVKPKIS
ncbi:NfeD family protein [Desulfobacula phenolica]|uniref:Membrane-bound serine protease (ClpP class) n=1 Tax=Desulfobacula phenolica TaxID=90732 RepID=A0A1H2IZ80_9BACT|nr:NfeD family protein [Desulfobacula phenolica]SDU49450.1 membrane-bound serine protease (ClpP class) [Desulfobacula phenolica]